MAKSMPITARSQSLKSSSDESLSQSSAGSSNKHRTIKQDKDKVHNQSNTTTAGMSSSNNDAADNGCNTHKKKKGPRRRLSLLLEQKIDIKMKRNSQREIQIDDDDDDESSSSSAPNDDEDDKDGGATRPGNSILRNGKFDSLFHEKQVDINALRIEDAVLAFIEDKKDKKQPCPPKEGKSGVSIHADRKKINATTTTTAAADNGRHNNSVNADTSTSSDNIRKKKKKGGPRRRLSLLLDQKIQTKTMRSSLDEDDEDALFPVVHKPFAKDTTRQTVVHKNQPVTTKNVEDQSTSRKPKTRPRRRLSLLLDEKMKEKERRDSSLF